MAMRQHDAIRPKTGWTGDVPAKKNGQTNKIHLSIRFGGTKMDTGHDDLASIQDAGTVVAVQNDAAIAAWVAENLPEAEVVAFEDGIDALMELNSERAQAAIVDEPRFRRYVQVKEPHLQAVELVASDKDYAFAVAAGNEALLTAVNEALTALRADGSYDALYDSWFGDAGIANVH